MNTLKATLPGVGVQLAFDPKKDKHPNTHGWVIVSIQNGDGEKSVIYEADDYQHNKNYHSMSSTARNVAEMCQKAMGSSGEITERE